MCSHKLYFCYTAKNCKNSFWASVHYLSSDCCGCRPSRLSCLPSLHRTLWRVVWLIHKLYSQLWHLLIWWLYSCKMLFSAYSRQFRLWLDSRGFRQVKHNMTAANHHDKHHCHCSIDFHGLRRNAFRFGCLLVFPRWQIIQWSVALLTLYLSMMHIIMCHGLSISQ